MATTGSPLLLSLQRRLWRGIARFAGYESGFPKGAELLEAWLLSRHEHWLAIRTLLFAVASGQGTYQRAIRREEWSRTAALASLLVVCIPARRRTSLTVSTYAIAM